MVADDGDGRGRGAVVFGAEHAAGGGGDAEHGEVVGGDELADEGVGELGGGGADAEGDAVGLGGCQFGELGGVLAEVLVEGAGEDGEAGLVAGDDAAGVVVAKAVECARVGDGEGFEEDGVDQREDGGVAADSEGQGEQGDGGEAGVATELAEGEEKIVRHYD